MQTRFQFLATFLACPFALFRPARPKLKWRECPEHDMPDITVGSCECVINTTTLAVYRCLFDWHEVWEVKAKTFHSTRWLTVSTEERSRAAAMARAEQIYYEIIPILQREIA